MQVQSKKTEEIQYIYKASAGSCNKADSVNSVMYLSEKDNEKSENRDIAILETRIAILQHKLDQIDTLLAKDKFSEKDEKQIFQLTKSRAEKDIESIIDSLIGIPLATLSFGFGACLFYLGFQTLNSPSKKLIDKFGAAAFRYTQPQSTIGKFILPALFASTLTICFLSLPLKGLTSFSGVNNQRRMKTDLETEYATTFSEIHKLKKERKELLNTSKTML